MAKQTPFFKFDSASWLGGSIQFTDLESKGLFTDLCALYWESESPIKIDKKLLLRVSVLEVHLSTLIENLSALEVIDVTEHGITVPFLDSLRNERENYLKNCAKGGKNSRKNKSTISHKKEERRKKKEEKEKTKAKNVCGFSSSKNSKLEDLVRPIFQKKNASELCDGFCQYWTAKNEITDLMRWEEDKYFKSSLSMKVGNWIDNNSKLKPAQHIHQEFLDIWITKCNPKNALIESAKRILEKHPDLTNETLIEVLKHHSLDGLDSLIKKALVLHTRNSKTNLTRSEAPQIELPEKEPTIDEIKAMIEVTGEEVYKKMCPNEWAKLQESGE